MIDVLFSGVKRIQTPVHWEAVVDLAQRNKHHILSPSHVVVKYGKIVGYGSAGTIPMTHYCFGSDMVAEDSFHAIHVIENLIEDRGGKMIVTPVSKESPFHSQMTHPKLGYELLGNVDLFLKNL